MSVPVDDAFFLDIASTILPSARGLRAISYFFVTLVLVSINTYGVTHPFWLALAMGVLAFTTRGAKIAVSVIALLAIMGAVPHPTLQTIVETVSTPV